MIRKSALTLMGAIAAIAVKIENETTTEATASNLAQIETQV